MLSRRWRREFFPLRHKFFLMGLIRRLMRLFFPVDSCYLLLNYDNN